MLYFLLAYLTYHHRSFNAIGTQSTSWSAMAPSLTHILQVTALLSDILRSYIVLLVTGKSSNMIVLSVKFRTFVGYVMYRIVHNLVLWPRYLSPLRHVPTAPGAELFMGHTHLLNNSEACIPQREWAKKLGPIVRFFGPFGSERLLFLQPGSLHQVLTKGWLDYPIVRNIWFYLKVSFSERSVKPAYVRNVYGIIVGHGLLTVTGDKHRLMKKVMNPAFSINNLMSRMYDHWLPSSKNHEQNNLQTFICITTQFMGSFRQQPSADTGIISSIVRLVKILNDQIDSQEEPQKGKVINVHDWSALFIFLS